MQGLKLINYGFSKSLMTVLWTVKVVNEWCEKYRGKDFSCYSEAYGKFGCWIHSASYGSCFELREMVERYLESKGVDIRLVSAATSLFCGAMEIEVEYDEHVYGLLRDALSHVVETGEEAIIRSHAEALIELITTAERLKSGIMCSG